MPVAPSFQDLLDQGQAEAVARRADLLFAEGDVSLAQLHAGAAMSDANVRHGAQMFAATLLVIAGLGTVLWAARGAARGNPASALNAG